MKKIVCLIFVLTCLAQILFPGTGNIKFEHITIREGLSQSSVRCFLQDRKGFMWFATVDGLNKYDGYSFKVSKPDPSDANSLSSPFLRGIIEDRSGIIWISTNGGGLNKLDPLTERFTRYQNDPHDPTSLSYNYVWVVYEDRSGRLWIGTDGGGLDKFDREKKTFVHYRYDPNDPNSLSADRVLSITEDREGMLWIGTRGGGLNKFDPASQRFTRFQNNPDDPGSLSNDYIWIVYTDPSGVLWVGTNSGGLNKFDRETQTFIHYRFDSTNPYSLSHDGVQAICQDRAGALWIGTVGGGVNKFDRSSGRFTRYQRDPNNPDSLSDNYIYSIYEDRSGVLWFGTEVGGVNKLDRNTEQFIHYRQTPNDPNSLSDNNTWSIYQDRSGILWIGTRTGGLNKIDREKEEVRHYFNDPDEPNSLSGIHIRAIYEAPTQPGILWIGADGGGLLEFDPNTGRCTRYRNSPGNPNSLSGNRIYSIYEDRSGVLWVGTRVGGLNRFDRQKKQFVHYRHDPNDPGSISNDYVYSIRQDRWGVLWVGTFAGGLNKFNRENETFVHFQNDVDDPHSLSSNCILSLHEDHSGVLWVGTGGGGLDKFDRQNRRFIHYNMEKGLPNEVIYGILEDRQGNLWLSTNDGIARFNPVTEKFKNYTEKDGLQSDEFNGGAYFSSPRTGEMFFGGINGFNSFYPEGLKDNTHVPPIAITAFLKFNKEVKLDRPISEIKEIELSYRDYVFSFEFAALDFTVPQKNKYAYKMEGLDDEWIYTDAWRRFATYTTLSPGEYVFRVKGSNNDETWNEEGVSLRIIITPPFWQTWWFRIIAFLLIFLVFWGLYRKRMKNLFLRTRMETELQTAHNAQMSIMPQKSPEINGFDIAGVCVPASEVGGDFYDYFWLDSGKKLFGIAVGDVSGKSMKAAMTAVMSNGIIFSKASETKSIKEIMTQLNQSLYFKTDKRVFTTLLIISIDIEKKEITYTNAGLPEPFLKSGDSVTQLKSAGSKFPLGIFPESNFREKKIQLSPGNIVVLFTDGISEAWNLNHEFYGSKNLKRLLQDLDTSNLSAKKIIDVIMDDIKGFSGDVKQHDDMTVVVVKVL